MKLRILFFFLVTNFLFAQEYHNTTGSIEVGSTGQLQFSLAIKTPPSTRNIDPQISLDYNSSNNSRGIAGYGFSLSGITSISRVSKNIEKDGEIKEIQLDNTDYFQFNGQRLLLKSGQYGTNGAEYYTEKYSNIKIKSIGAVTGQKYQGPEYFEITYEDGSQAWYGQGDTSRTSLEYSIVKWKDAQGNYITYTYRKSFEVLLVSKIEWGGNETLSLPHTNQIIFNYDAFGGERWQHYNSNRLEYSQNSRLFEIVVNANGNLFRKYVVAYGTTPETVQKVINIKEYNPQNQAANPVVFDYETSNSTGWTYNNFTNNDNNQIVGDFDGDGTLDFFKYYTPFQECTQWTTQLGGIGAPSKQVCVQSTPSAGGVYFFNSFIGQSKKQYLTADYSRFTGVDFNKAKAISFLDTNNQLSTKQGILVSRQLNNSSTGKSDLELQVHSLNGNQLKFHYSKILPNDQFDISYFYETDEVEYYSTSQALTDLVSTKEMDVDGDGVSEIVLVFQTTYTDIYIPKGDYAIEKSVIVPNENNINGSYIEGPISNIGQPIYRSRIVYNYVLVSMAPTLPASNSFSAIRIGSDSSKNIFDKAYIADFNGNGKSDILDVDNYQGTPQLIEFSKNKTSQIYTPSQTTMPIENYSTGAIGTLLGIKEGAVLGDYNGDGKTDLFIPIQVGTTKWMMYLSKGIGFFGEAHDSSSIYPIYQPGLTIVNGSVSTGWFTSSATQDRYKNSVYAMDLDKDGKSEIISTNYHAYRIVDRAGDYTSYNIKIIRSEGGGGYRDVYFPQIDHQFSFTEGNFYDYNELLGDFRLNQINNQIIILGKDILSANGSTRAFSFFNTPKRNRIAKITQAGLTTEIEYKELDPITAPNFYAPIQKENYPFVELDRMPQSFVVSQLRYAGKKQDFMYNGFLVHLQGRGMLGFRKIARTSWYASGFENTKVWSGLEMNPLNNGVVIKEWSSRTEPFPLDLSLTNTQLVSLKLTNYDPQVLPTGVTVNSVIKSTSKDFLKDVTTETTISYDPLYLPKEITVKINNGFATKKTELDYYNNLTGAGNAYFVGKTKYKIETSTAYSDTKRVKEEYTYQNNLLQTVKKFNQDESAFVLETYTPDEFGNSKQITVTNSNDAQTVNSLSEYDAKGLFVKKTIDNLGLVTEYTFNNYGQVLTQKDPFANLVTSTYDAWGKLLTTTHSLTGTTSYAYVKEAGGNIKVSETTPTGAVNESYTNVKGENYLVTTYGFAQGTIVAKKTEFDALSRIVKQSEPFYAPNETPKWNTITYDDSVFPSRVTTTSYTGKVIETTVSGRTINTSESNGYLRTFKKEVDPIGNIITSDDKGGTIRYTYNSLGQNTASIYDQNTVTTSYDTWGRRMSFTDSSNGTYLYDYTGLGDVKKVTSKNGTKEYVYNTVGQLEKQNETSNDGKSTLKNITYGYNPKGLVTNKSGTANGKAYSATVVYDTYGRMESTTENSNNRSYSQKNIVYDTKSRVASYEKELVSAGGTTTAKIENVYNLYDGSLYQLKNKTTQDVLWQLQEIKANGQVVKERFAVVNSVNTYNAANDLLTGINQSSKFQPVLQLSYSFSALKNELNSRSRTGIFTINEAFVYDTNNRLTSWTNPKTGLLSTNSYDDKGRITTNDQVGDIVFDPAKVYQASKITLNPAGEQNYLNDTPQIITYNENNDPVFIDGQKGDVRFEYGLGYSRQMTTYGGDITATGQGLYTKYYNEDGDFEITVNNTTGQEKHTLYIEGTPYDSNIVLFKNYQETTPSYLFLHKDYLGSLLAISDASGTVVESRHFDAWGNLTNGAMTLLDRGYTGHEHFAEVGIIHMNGRLYDPLLRRFLNADQNIQDPFNTQNYNKYAYVMNNPLLYTDPSGETSQEPPGGCIECWGTMDQRMTGFAIASIAQNWDSLGIKDWANSNLSDGFKSGGNWLTNNLKSINNFADRNLRSIGRDIGNLFGLNNNTPASSFVPSAINMQSTGAFLGAPVSNNTSWQTGGFKVGGNNLTKNPQKNIGEKPLNWFHKEHDGSLWEVANNDNKVTKGALVLYTHGNINSISGPNGEDIRSASDLNKILIKHSPQWKNFIDKGGKFTLVLKACNTGEKGSQTAGVITNRNFARDLTYDINGLTVIAPNGMYRTAGFLGIYFEVGVKSDNGLDTWNAYYNSILIKRFND
jgi:RHS repeat-associated protein